MAPGSSKNYGWDTKPKLDEQRFLAPEETRPSRGKKDRRRWCRGKVGIEHKVVYRLSKSANYVLARGWHQHECRWKQRHCWQHVDGARKWLPTDEWYYTCGHERGCEECGKVLTSSWRLPPRECPDYKPREQ